MRVTLLRADRDQLRLVLACLVVEGHHHHAERRRLCRPAPIYRNDDAGVVSPPGRHRPGKAAVADCAPPWVVLGETRNRLAAAVDDIETHDVVRKSGVRRRET